MAEKPHKLTKSELLLLDELSKPFSMLETTSGMHGSISVSYHDENWKRLDEKDKVRWPHREFWKLVTEIPEPDYPKYGRGQRPFWLRLYLINDAGRAALEANRAALDKIKATMVQEQAQVDRFVIVGYNRGWGGGHGAGRTYCQLLRVLRETDNRLYVQAVMSAHDVTNGYGSYYGHSPVHGRNKDQYVDRADVLVDPATEAQFRALVALDDDRMASAQSINKREEDELAPIKKRWEDSRKQQAAMFADMEKEILKK